jgi:hypothetical protein
MGIRKESPRHRPKAEQQVLPGIASGPKGAKKKAKHSGLALEPSTDTDPTA